MPLLRATSGTTPVGSAPLEGRKGRSIKRMKAEHRKELQTNTLADHIGRWIQGLRHGMKAKPAPSTLVVMIFVFLALVVFVGWRYYSSSQQRKRSHLWLELDEARSLADVEEIAEKNPKT